MPSNVPGYLQPTSAAPLDGTALEDFFQAWLVGLSGLSGSLVRPAYQPEPPNLPDPSVTDVWVAFSFDDVDQETFPAFVHQAAGNGQDEMRRNERFDVVISTYGLGAGSNARQVARLMRDNASVPQNLEPLFLAGMGFNDCTSLVRVPSLLAERWLYRVDFRVRISRVIVRDYQVLNLLESKGTVTGQTPDGSSTTSNFNAENP